MKHPWLRTILVAALVVQLVFPPAILAAAVGRFTALSGDVTQTHSGVTKRPDPQSPVQAMDLIVTGGASTASILFDDESTIALAPNTRFEVKEFQIGAGVRKGLFSLALGRLKADVRRFIGGDSSFAVQTPTAIAGVRGTGFMIAVAMMGTQLTTTVACTAGAMTVSALSVTGAVLSTATIVAGQTAIISGGVIGVSATAAGVGAGATGSGFAGAGGTAAGSGAAGAGVGAGATGAAGAGAAGAGVAAGSAATAGVAAGTVAAGVAVTAAAVAAVAAATGSTSTTTHHSATPQH